MNHHRKPVLKRIFIGLVFFGLLGAAVWADRVMYRHFINPPPPPGWNVISPPENVMAIAIGDDVVWAGGNDGVWEIDRKGKKVIKTIESDPPMTYVKDILIDEAGDVWIAHFNGLSRYDGTRLTTYTTADGLPDNRVNTVLIDHNGALWVGTWGGAAIVRNRDFSHVETVTAADGLLDNMVNIMLNDSAGWMWFGSHTAPSGGISCFRDGQWRYFTVEQGLPHNSITSFFEEAPGVVWAGTGYFERGGAVLFSEGDGVPRIDRVLTKTDGLAGWRVRTVFMDSNGDLWFGSETDGIARLHDGAFFILSKRDGFPHNEITSIREDNEKNLWFGTLGGVTVIDRNAITTTK